MTSWNQELIVSLARGSWQRGIAQELATGDKVINPIRSLRGRAKTYAGKYQSSFNSLLTRIEKAGFMVAMELGPHGGSWAATYQVMD